MNARTEGQICPWCAGEMEAGLMMSKSGSGAGLYYLPRGQSPGAFDTPKRIGDKGGIVLEGPSLTRFSRISVDCSMCRSCRKIVVSY